MDKENNPNTVSFDSTNQDNDLIEEKTSYSKIFLKLSHRLKYIPKD